MPTRNGPDGAGSSNTGIVTARNPVPPQTANPSTAPATRAAVRQRESLVAWCGALFSVSRQPRATNRYAGAICQRYPSIPKCASISTSAVHDRILSQAGRRGDLKKNPIRAAASTIKTDISRMRTATHFGSATLSRSAVRASSSQGPGGMGIPLRRRSSSARHSGSPATSTSAWPAAGAADLTSAISRSIRA